MLDIAYIRDHAKDVQDNCAKRGVSLDIAEVLRLDEERRACMRQIEDLRAERNKKSKTKPTPDVIAELKRVGETIGRLEVEQERIETAYRALLLQIPNMTHPDAPIGGEDAFIVREEKNRERAFDFTPKDHEELLTSLDLIDFERAAKVAGSKFYFCKNDLVRLNQALINYGLDTLSEKGYALLETPDLAKNDILSGTGYQPRGEETQIYSIENTDLSLIATAEITVGGYHAGEVLDLSHGPKKYAALSHCFRVEAGAYGRTSKGLYRVHQFTKLEMFIFCAPEDSERMHHELLSIEKEICDGLELEYRVIDIPTGDLGGPAYRKYDIEARMVMKDFGEITSTSNCTDYQARRLQIKYTDASGETPFVHTLNGTAIALSRLPLAIVEQHQTAQGTIRIPQVLRPYFGKDHIG